jgi:CMP-N,N'-diacetyllegionaminic acid synthase
MRILGVIPARGGSKSVPRKNIKLIAGKPLIAWTIESSKDAGLSRLVLSTDDEEIAAVGREYGVEVPFMRPAELATDKAYQIPGIQWAVGECEKTDGRYDAVMMLQPTAPMRTQGDIIKAIKLFKEDETLDSVISLTPASEFPERMKYLDEDGNIEDPLFCEKVENQSRQELRPIFEKNGAIYLTRRDVLMETGSLKGKKSKGLIITQKRSVNIDTPFEFMLADIIMSQFDWQSWE